jgi:hypothetical protein
MNPSQFVYENHQVNPDLLCPDNDLHALLYGKGSTQNHSPVLVTINNPPRVTGQLDIAEIEVDRFPLDKWMAKAQALFLSERGIRIAAADITNKLQAPLITSYMLSSSVTVVKVNKQRGVEYALVTKNPDMISALRTKLAPADQKKGFDQFQAQFSTSYTEITTGTFQVIRLLADIDGIRLRKMQVSAKGARHAIPYYAVNNYAAKLMSIFSRNQVLLTFRDEQGADVSIKTTLMNDVLAKWLGTSATDVELSKWIDWSDPASMGYISMPDLSNRGEFVSVPVLNIKSLQPV